MKQMESMAAELLSASAPAYAAIAANQLIESLPEIQDHFGDSAFSDWKAHYQQRLMELSAALAEDESRLFISRVIWARSAFKAREVPQHFLQASLHSLRQVLDQELPENFQGKTLEFIDAALSELDKTEDDPDAPNVEQPNTMLAMRYLVNILEGDSRGAIQLVLDATHKGLSVQDAYEQVLLVAQREIGKMWHRAEVTIAEEHIVTSTTMRTMAVLCQQAEPAADTGRVVVSAAVARNAHDIGVRAVADFFELAGWKSICLGGDTPAADMADAARCFGAHLVLISAAMSTQLKAVRESIESIRHSAPNCKIMVGGTAFDDAPELWKQVGADGYSENLSTALSNGSALVDSILGG